MGSSAYAEGDKLSKDDKKWLEQEVAALITAEEIEIFKDLRSKDRKLFKEIFWARRDPDPMTPQNEFIGEFEDRVKAANERFSGGPAHGSRTDMGKVFLLLGNPADTSRRGDQSVAWEYEPNPSLGIPDGLTVQFRNTDVGPRMVGAKDVEKTLERVKTYYLMNRSISYSRDEKGRLLKPSAELDPNSPAKKLLQAMLETKTENPAIPFEARTSFFRAEEGAIYIATLFEIDAGALSWDKDTAKATIFGAVQNAEGQTLYPFEQPVELKNQGGLAVYEMPIQVAPGQYTFHFGVLDNKSEAVGTRVLPVEVPDFSRGDLVMSSVLVYSEGRNVPDIAGTPGNAFQFGPTHFVPVPGAVFTFKRSDNVGFFYFVYGAGLDEGTGEPSLTEQYIFFKDGKRLTQTAVQPLQASPSFAIGNAEIPLSGFAPGNYKIQIKVIDKVRKETATQDLELVLEGAPEPGV
jgi:GWxTD domain-containing protein